MECVWLQKSHGFAPNFFAVSFFVNRELTQGGLVEKNGMLMQRGGEIQNYGRSYT
jgi:hypothetical protein